MFLFPCQSLLALCVSAFLRSIFVRTQVSPSTREMMPRRPHNLKFLRKTTRFSVTILCSRRSSPCDAKLGRRASTGSLYPTLNGSRSSGYRHFSLRRGPDLGLFHMDIKTVKLQRPWWMNPAMAISVPADG
ncbi:hypothetical protein SNOG_11757 [Parastagonospora nodorum SN15]|uniref:Secreted protein n=1 Tax=Phaeosphaeria nodorum (strain SN15 / ATCC MYA-4574 / FGSC 10173) TaxID=321614 RepID=Q0U907_PHANO|nr:hypothetical protein SNOG_11757 [Parastagonospora nodorum SN15]EAT80801.1 hypothetical protein SNOG_11757 [Parastagonospora nodorum SN15]